MTPLRHLQMAGKILRQRARSRARLVYAVPGLWQPGASTAAVRSRNVNPYDFYARVIGRILRQRPQRIRKTRGGAWTRDAVIYNMFVRTTTAFDHNQNGRLDLPLSDDGWRETGSFLKGIAQLPLIRSMGVDTIHLLPITSIGMDGNKGTLGSPYAIKNPYEIDPSLGEPNLGLGAENEFAAFVEAAHHLGMRVVVEFVFRTSAKDGDWVAEHPEWFYWIKAKVDDRQPGEHDETKYGNPMFTAEELANIKDAVHRHDHHHLTPPHPKYREMFTNPPLREWVVKEDGRWIGLLDDGTRVRIPGAFADWPPDDAQPPWGDVTYLKMYDHPDFNYMAYNTLRMYDARLAQGPNVNRPLWERIAQIIPHYQHTFGIDGVMIDMGHALPMELKHDMIRRARTINPDFAFWDENFSVTAKSVQEGYNAVIGYQWADQHHPEKFRKMLHRFAHEGFPLSYFATPESHNTPRAAARPGGTRYSAFAWAVSCFIPAVPFIHSGFELGETLPINTGLDFTAEQLKELPSEKLPLFSEHAYDWTSKANLVGWIRLVAATRTKYRAMITNTAAESFHWHETSDQYLLVFTRRSKRPKQALFVAANADMVHPRELQMGVETRKRLLKDLLRGHPAKVGDGVLKLKLAPGQVFVAEL